MAVTLENNVDGGTTGGDLTLPSITIEADELLIVTCGFREDADTITPTLSGITFVSLGRIVNGQGQNVVQSWRAMPTSQVIGQIVLSGTILPIVAWASTWSGAITGNNGGDAIGAQADNTENDNDDMRVDITTAAANSVVIAVGTHRNSLYTLQTGETSVGTKDLTAGSGGGIVKANTVHEDVASASGITIGAVGSLSSDRDWVIMAIEVKVATAAAARTLFQSTVNQSLMI